MAARRIHNAKPAGTEDRESRLSCPTPSTQPFVCQTRSPSKFDPSPDGEAVDSSVCGEHELSVEIDAYYWVPSGVSQTTPTASPARSSAPSTPTPSSYPRLTQSTLSKNGSSVSTNFRRWMDADDERDARQESEDRRFFEEADQDRVNTFEAWPGFAQWLAQRGSHPQSPQSFRQTTPQSPSPPRKHLTSPTLPRSQATSNPRSARRAQRAHRIACQLTRELASLDSIRARLRRRQQKMLRLALGSN